MKYLGIDWGMKRIGLATSEGELARPLTTLSVSSQQEALSKISNLVKQERVETIILGVPEGKMAKIIQKIAQKLPVEVILADETLTSQTAIQLMIKSGVGKKDRRDDDAFAAALILQNFLDNRVNS